MSRLANIPISVACGLALALTAPALGNVIYVNNLTGVDTNDGTSAETAALLIGPVRTIRRALILARRADTIVLTNTGQPYYEGIALSGTRNSGFERFPFTIAGNGATLSGLQSIPPHAWKYVGGTLWKFTPVRKGHAQLVRDDQVVPAAPRPATAEDLHKIPAQQWTTWNGSIYYQSTPLEFPTEVSFHCAQVGVGLSLYRVQNVRILDLNIQHFRTDGVNAFDGCRNVLLQNVVARENGRNGITATGTSECYVDNCQFESNRGTDRQVTEFATLQNIQAKTLLR